MPAKIIKTDSGRIIILKSVMLSNGNLLIPKRLEHGVDWVEVDPTSADYKRWLPVAVDEPDPRIAADYLAWKIEATNEL